MKSDVDGASLAFAEMLVDGDGRTALETASQVQLRQAGQQLLSGFSFIEESREPSCSPLRDDVVRPSSSQTDRPEFSYG